MAKKPPVVHSIDGIPITPDVIHALKELRDEGPGALTFLSRQSLLIGSFDAQSYGIDTENLFQLLVKFHDLLSAMFEVEKGGGDEKN